MSFMKDSYMQYAITMKEIVNIHDISNENEQKEKTKFLTLKNLENFESDLLELFVENLSDIRKKALERVELQSKNVRYLSEIYDILLNRHNTYFKDFEDFEFISWTSPNCTESAKNFKKIYNELMDECRALFKKKLNQRVKEINEEIVQSCRGTASTST